MNKITLGTRGSKLALYQSKLVADKLQNIFPDLKIVTKIIKTKGDILLNANLSKVLDKGFFTSEIQAALHTEEIDLAVHSLKDLPTSFDEKSVIGAILKREDHRDVFLSKNKKSLNEFNDKDIIGTSSLRRTSQLLLFNPILNIHPIRGNVDTRVQKMLDGDYDGLVMAAAGIKRLGLEEHITEYLDLDKMMTAPGQGAIAVEIRSDDDKLKLIVESLNDEDTKMCVGAERSFLNRLGGGCQVPFAAYSNIIENGLLRIDALVTSLDGESIVRKTNFGKKEKFMSLGLDIADAVLSSGGYSIIENLKRNG